MPLPAVPGTTVPLSPLRYTTAWNLIMVTGNESVLIQLAQCRFPRLAISNSEILVYFSNKMYRSNFIKQHSETVVVWNYQNADCSLRKKCYCVIYYNFRHTFIPYFMACSHNRPVCCFFVPQLSFQFQYFLLQSVHNLHNTHTANNNSLKTTQSQHQEWPPH